MKKFDTLYSDLDAVHKDAAGELQRFNTHVFEARARQPTDLAKEALPAFKSRLQTIDGEQQAVREKLQASIFALGKGTMTLSEAEGVAHASSTPVTQLTKKSEKLKTEISEKIEIFSTATGLATAKPYFNFMLRCIVSDATIPKELAVILKKVKILASKANKVFQASCSLKSERIPLEKLKEEQAELLLKYFKDNDNTEQVTAFFKDGSKINPEVLALIKEIIPQDKLPKVSVVAADLSSYDADLDQIGIDVHSSEAFQDEETALNYLNGALSTIQGNLTEIIEDFDQTYDKKGDFAKPGSLARGAYFAIWDQLTTSKDGLKETDSLGEWNKNLKKIGALLAEKECFETADMLAGEHSKGDVEQAQRGLVLMELRDYVAKAGQVLDRTQMDKSKIGALKQALYTLVGPFDENVPGEHLFTTERLEKITQKDLSAMRKKIDESIDAFNKENTKLGYTRLTHFEPFAAWSTDTTGPLSSNKRTELQKQLRKHIL